MGKNTSEKLEVIFILRNIKHLTGSDFHILSISLILSIFNFIELHKLPKIIIKCKFIVIIQLKQRLLRKNIDLIIIN